MAYLSVQKLKLEVYESKNLMHNYKTMYGLQFGPKASDKAGNGNQLVNKYTRFINGLVK